MFGVPLLCLCAPADTPLFSVDSGMHAGSKRKRGELAAENARRAAAEKAAAEAAAAGGADAPVAASVPWLAALRLLALSGLIPIPENIGDWTRSDLRYALFW